MLENSLFQQLPLRNQIDLLSKRGDLIARRTHNKWSVTLYSLDGNFVEVWAGNEMEVVATFRPSANKLAILDPYIDTVNVQTLFS